MQVRVEVKRLGPGESTLGDGYMDCASEAIADARKSGQHRYGDIIYENVSTAISDVKTCICKIMYRCQVQSIVVHMVPRSRYADVE